MIDAARERHRDIAGLSFDVADALIGVVDERVGSPCNRLKV
jgi:hypothetical protein